MTLTSFANNVKNAILNKLSGDMSKVFIATTVIGYVASSAGQLHGINKNNKLDNDKKEFLKFQEIADCAINILAYFTITKGFTKFSKNLASSAKILSKEIVEKSAKANINLDNVKNLGNEITQKIAKLTNSQEKIDTSAIQDLKNLQDKYVPFESGMAMLGTISGGLISTNFVAPILRNQYASKKKNGEIIRPQIVNTPIIKNSGLKI